MIHSWNRIHYLEHMTRQVVRRWVYRIPCFKLLRIQGQDHTVNISGYSKRGPAQWTSTKYKMFSFYTILNKNYWHVTPPCLGDTWGVYCGVIRGPAVTSLKIHLTWFQKWWGDIFCQIISHHFQNMSAVPTWSQSWRQTRDCVLTNTTFLPSFTVCIIHTFIDEIVAETIKCISDWTVPSCGGWRKYIQVWDHQLNNYM